MGGAPCHLYVLMWKNWIYYKRHYLILVWTFVKPLLVFAILAGFLYLPKSQGTLIAKYRPCTSAGESLATDGPVPALLNILLQSNLSTSCEGGGGPGGDTGMGPGTCKEDGSQSQSCVDTDMISDADKRILENAEKSPSWINKLKSIDATSPLRCRPDPSKKSQHMPPDREEKQMHLICTLLEKKILYYPNSSFAKKIMGKVEEVILEFETFVNDATGNVGASTSLPKSTNTTVSIDPTLNVSQCPGLEKGVNDYRQLLNKYINKAMNGTDKRVIGFASLKHLQNYTYPLSKAPGKSDENLMLSNFPGIWRILSFQEMPSDVNAKDARLQFSFVYDAKMTEQTKLVNDETLWLQDIVEEAIIEAVSRKDVQIGTVLKNNPSKCWHKPTANSYGIFAAFFTLFTFLAFMSQPATFLYQILAEKELKLREYLYIMGVSSMMLKMSWILFYSSMLLPLAFLWCTLVVVMYGEFLALSNVSFFYVLLMGYNISMLCFCYMLSNLFQAPKGSGPFVYFIQIFIVGIGIFNFGHSMSPGTAYLARLLSLHPAVPFIIGVSFMLAWEKEWVGATWSNIWMSPTSTDIYHGLGEALLWMLASIIIYIFLAWYLEMLFPGEFGQAQPFYFLFTPTYWRPPHSTMPDEIEEPKADVEPVHGKEAGIAIDKLSKVYSKGKIALNQLSLIFYKNEITAFLGHNGAGKSTTMNCLVGMINVSGGTATVAGHDIRKNIESVRKMVGFVPQYDILYPEFKVRDHCKFYGWLKNMSTEEIAQMTEMMLARMGLSEMIDQKTIVLSGGQKRKLSVITAYFGSPSVVIFDEPTSGVDPFSRRAIWEAILAHKSATTTVLSTHFMDEADILGNRIAVINEGELKCAGSPMYLKSKYGKGYRLTIARKPDAREAVIGLMAKLLPESQQIEELGNDMDFQLSKETAHSDRMIEILRSIEDSFESVGIQSYAVNEPSMNEVFFTCTAAENVHHEILGSEHAGETSDQLEYEKCQNLGQQAAALFIKKFWSSITSPSLILLQTVIPLVFVILLLLGSSGGSGHEKTLISIPGITGQNMLFMQNYDGNDAANNYLRSSFTYGYPPICPGDSCNPKSEPIAPIASSHKFAKTCDCESFCDVSEIANKEAHTDLPNGAKMFALGKEANASSWILLVNQSHDNLIAGFQFHAGDETCAEYYGTSKHYVTVFYHEKVKHAVLNLWHTFLLRNMTGLDRSNQIQVYLEPQRLADPTLTSTNQVLSTMVDMFKGIFIVLAFIFGSFGVIIALYSETSSGLKRLQLIYGANPYLYWAVNLGFDMLMHLCTLLVIVLPVAIFANPFQDYAGAVFLVGILYGYHTITYFYLMSFICTKSSTTIGFTIFLGMLNSLASILMGTFINANINRKEMSKCGNIKNDDTAASVMDNIATYAVPINHVLTFQPSYLIGETIITIGMHHLRISLMDDDVLDFMCKVQNCMCGMKDVFAFAFLGQRLLKFFLFGTINLIMVMVMEALDFKCSCSRGKGKNMVWSGQSSEPDVATEQARVEAGGANNDTLMVKHLCKSFVGMPYPAVNNISFGVPKAETFGLLGLNGAGKTTTFSMLTGFVTPTSGSASILGVDLLGHSWSRFKNSSYCPQENKLFSKLTIEQHIKLFAALRGIPSSAIDELMKRLIVEVGLEPHKGKRAGALSGGNQRKLNFALALIDYRPVIFLDEPTSGMDPGAKKRTWACVKRAVGRGCSVVLTSHSMEECEALCHRVVIMATGNFLCIGSIQYLKHKFGEKYVFKIKLQAHAASGEEPIKVKGFIEASLPAARLIEEHAAMLSYEIIRYQGFKLSHLSEVLLTCRRTFLIEDISICQSSLEEIFISMGNNQAALAAQQALHAGPAAPNAGQAAPSAGQAAPNAGQAAPNPIRPSPKSTSAQEMTGSSGSTVSETPKANVKESTRSVSAYEQI